MTKQDGVDALKIILNCSISNSDIKDELERKELFMNRYGC